MSTLRTFPSLLLAASICAGLVACGGNPALENAQTTVAQTSHVLTDLDQRVSRGPSAFGADAERRAPQGAQDPVFRRVRATVVDAQRSLHDAEQAVDAWVADEEKASIWPLVLPCLAASLTHVQDALVSFGVAPGVELEQLVTATTAETNGSVCVPQTR